jgi:hypothetical protein
MITPTASSHGGVPTQDKAKEVPSNFQRAGRDGRQEANVRRAHEQERRFFHQADRPGDTLLGLATEGRDRRGAHLKFADDVACIKYDIPAERTPRADYLSGIVNGASDDFRLEYLSEIWDLVGLPRNECQVVNVSEIRVPLHRIFSGEFQSGRAAAAGFNFVCESLGKIPRIVEFGSPQHLQRIELEAIRDRIVRIEQDQDANWKADYWVFLKGDTSKESGS